MAWSWNPITDVRQGAGKMAGDIGRVARDYGSVFVGSSKEPGLHLFTSAGGSPTATGPAGSTWGEPAKPDLQKSSPVDFIQSYMHASGAPSGVSASQVYDYLAAKDPKSLKNADELQKALNQYSQYAGWGTPGAAGTQTSAGIIDPLAIQQFFQGTIAPYLNQVATGEQTTANQLRNQPMVPGIPAAYAATIKAGEQTQATDLDMLTQATQAAGAVAPQVSQLNQMLGLAQKASLQDYYKQLATGTTGGAAQQVAAPVGGW
jgi:hypothetical protein